MSVGEDGLFLGVAVGGVGHAVTIIVLVKLEASRNNISDFPADTTVTAQAEVC